MRFWKLVGISGLAAVATAACSTGTSEKLFPVAQGTAGTTSGAAGTEGGGEAGTDGGGGETNGGAAGSGIQVGGGAPGSGGSNGSSVNCPNLPADVDSDADGFTPDDGDANDCDPNVNPSAIDVINFKKDEDGNPTDEPLPDEEQIDEDGDGVALLPSDPPVTCDSDLPVKIGDPFDAARAMGLCNVGVEENPADPRDRKWGVISAKFSDISGSFLKSPPKSGANPGLQLGILPDLGPATVPFEGAAFLALSSGVARAPGQEGFEKTASCGAGSGSKSYSSSTSSNPPGFPKNGDCGTSGQPNDGIGLDLRIRVPSNAKSFKFNFRFFTCEYPTFVCSSFNDVFAVLMAPSPLPKGDFMSDKDNTSANIAFEATDTGKKNVIGVNNSGFLTACKPGAVAASKPPYPNCVGDEDLVGSGFDGRGASSWLESNVPIPEFPPGADRIISLRFAIWDSSDHILDSSTVVDNFRWSAEEGTSVGTVIVPPPK